MQSKLLAWSVKCNGMLSCHVLLCSLAPSYVPVYFCQEGLTYSV